MVTALGTGTPLACRRPLTPRLERIVEAAVAEVRERLDALERGADAPDEPADEWPAYRQPTCAEDAYRVGDRVTWQGRRYVCAYEGAVWTPAEYPAAWAEWVEPGTDADAETEVA